MRCLIILLVFVLAMLIACAGKKQTLVEPVEEWTYGKMIYVDSTLVKKELLDSLAIQPFPIPNGYQFKWIEDISGAFGIRGLQERKRYRLSVVFGHRARSVTTKEIFFDGSPNYSIILVIPKEIEGRVEKIETDDDVGTGIGNVKKERP
jgi:hypothetical protein